jgi:hypothetical protein
MDMNDVAVQMSLGGEAGAGEGKSPERPEDVGEGLVKGGFVTHEELFMRWRVRWVEGVFALWRWSESRIQ